jgi:hypothetical protein
MFLKIKKEEALALLGVLPIEGREVVALDTEDRVHLIMKVLVNAKPNIHVGQRDGPNARGVELEVMALLDGPTDGLMMLPMVEGPFVKPMLRGGRENDLDEAHGFSRAVARFGW